MQVNRLMKFDTGLKVGQATLHEESGIHTGVTIIFPRGLEDTALHPCYAATHDLNGAGELTGCHMLREWGYLRAVCCQPYQPTLPVTIHSTDFTSP